MFGPLVVRCHTGGAANAASRHKTVSTAGGRAYVLLKPKQDRLDVKLNIADTWFLFSLIQLNYLQPVLNVC